MQTQADLDRLSTGLENCQVRLIELAVHDGLKEGDKQDRRPDGQKPEVKDEFAESIGASCVLKMLIAAIAMLGMAWVAVKTGHPDKIQSARTWIGYR